MEQSLIPLWAAGGNGERPHPVRFEYDPERHQIHVCGENYEGEGQSLYVGSSTDLGAFCEKLIRYCMNTSPQDSGVRIVHVAFGVWFYHCITDGTGKFYQEIEGKPGHLIQIAMDKDAVFDMCNEIPLWYRKINEMWGGWEEGFPKP